VAPTYAKLLLAKDYNIRRMKRGTSRVSTGRIGHLRSAPIRPAVGSHCIKGICARHRSRRRDRPYRPWREFEFL